MSDEARQAGSAREKRRVVVVRHGDEECCEGLLQSSSGEPLQVAIEAALAGREHGVSVRVSEEVLAKLDVLVQSGICESRSAAATFLIREGITANAEVFRAVESTSRQIADLRESLRERLAALGKQVADDGD